MDSFGREFFNTDPVSLAKKLLGKVIVRKTDEGEIRAAITETEAYGGEDDPASHAYTGRTKRNWPMFEKPGLAYVYFIYGNHYCLNVTSRPVGAVLIRSVKPLEGRGIMIKNRGGKDDFSGPGKVTQALKIGLEFNGYDISNGKEFFITFGPKPSCIEATPRIGITKATSRRWRFL
ncbi:MAG: DNA-3-methyladenine glycosylase, partial [Candidatus Micrarchaeota archaeon]|nr:DNA-3-methyladenine glycosylase [Candidatus Micrarchaeota archaeon]